jgi:hypothetical protein
MLFSDAVFLSCPVLLGFVSGFDFWLDWAAGEANQADMMCCLESFFTQHNGAKRQRRPVTPFSLGSSTRTNLQDGNLITTFTPIVGANRALPIGHPIHIHAGPENQLVYAIHDAVLKPMFGDFLVESQDIEWLPLFSHFDANTDYKPDLLLQHQFFVKKHVSSTPPRTTGGSHRELFDTVFGVLKCEMSNVTTSNEHLGKIVGYLDCLDGSISEYCLGRALKSPTSRGLLFDRTHAVLLDAIKGSVTRMTTCQWTDEGSFDLIRNHFLTTSRPAWHSTMETLDATLRNQTPAIGIRPFGFLGAGGFGRVFRLEMPADEANKVVVGDTEQLMLCNKEFKCCGCAGGNAHCRSCAR